MPIHDLGYREWKRALKKGAARWWVMAESGVTATWKVSWVRRILLFSWLPTLVWGVFIFLYERYALQIADLGPGSFPPGLRLGLIRDLGAPPELFQKLLDDPAAARSDLWSFLILSFFRTPQAVGLAILIGLVAPPLIARDLRSRAFLLYFSRPLTRVEYIIGKSFTVWLFTAMISMLPALLLYVEAVMLSSDLSVLADTWHLPLRIIAGSVVLIVPTTAVALCFSAMTRENRFASFAWFAVWIVGGVSYQILAANDKLWPLVSPYHSLGEIQRWIFGFGSMATDVPACAIFWSIVTVLAFAVIYRKISAPMNV